MNVPVTLQRLWVQLTADRRRFGVLCAALAVGLLLWGRAIIVTNVPRTAVADPDAQSPAKSADGGEVSDAKRAAEQRPARPRRETVAVQLDRLPRRDPFMISGEHFPKALEAAPVRTGNGFVELTEDPELTEARLFSTLQGYVSKLKLEAVMSGVPMVLINGRTYRIGDLIPAAGQADVMFELVEVKQRSVVIEYQGRRFDLSMATPGN